MIHPHQQTATSQPSRSAQVMNAASGWFAETVQDAVARNGSTELFKSKRARHLFHLIHRSIESGYYTYQQPLDGRCGARARVANQDLLLFSSYDYLGLIGHSEIETAAVAAIQKYGTGPGGVRLLTGTSCLHRELEQRLAAFKETEAAMTVTSGYLANIAVIPALVGRDDRVLLDARSHHSLVDGCRLAGVPYQFFAHNDMSALEHKLVNHNGTGRTLVIVEGIYSMDGDLCPLPDVVELKKRHGAILLVDEAHSLGVIGTSGKGVHEHFGISAKDVDFWTGSLSKTIPANGGFVASSVENIVYLQHAAGPYFFSSALCPAMTATALAALDVIESEPERIQRTAKNACKLKEALIDSGFDVGNSVSPIVPAILGNEETTWRFASRLLDEGIWATAIATPAVPRGKARLRLCAMASHTDADITELLDAMNRCRCGRE